MSEQNKLNITFSVARVFAVISIVSAHINIGEPEWIQKMISSIGSIGVIVFIVLSGYFYHSQKYKNLFLMLKEKARTIMIPWFVFGSLYYFYSLLVGGNGFNVFAWFGYILGNKTFLCYLTMLMMCYFIFYKRNKFVMYISMILTVLSVYLTAFGLLDGVIGALNITNYLNIFNWIGYFAIGYLIQEVKSREIYDFLKQTMFVSIPLFIVCYLLINIFKIQTGYFSFVELPYQLIAAWAFLSFSTFECLDKPIVHKLSNTTFGVYLIHMFTISFLLKIAGITVITKLLSSIFVVLVCTFILQAGYIISRKLKLDKIYCIVTGIRGDRF